MKSIDSIYKKKNNFSGLISEVFFRFAAFFELAFIVLIWYFIFSGRGSFGEFDFREMIAYLLVGNMIGLFSSYFLFKAIRFSSVGNDYKMFYYKPFLYLFRVLKKGFKRIIAPFIFSIAFNLLLLYFFVDKVYFNVNSGDLLLVFLIIFLSFVFELFLAFFLNIYSFWFFHSTSFSSVYYRLKKILSGAYFPLGFLGPNFLSISLLFPFAYTFYVPTQIYLGNISRQHGLAGIFVQIFWIVLVYFAIKFSWRRKIEKDKEIPGRKPVVDEIYYFI